jgi:antitoxin YefM
MINIEASDILPATTVKRRFLELLKRLGPERSVITVTRNGVAAGVLMSVDEYESLVETLEILADPKLVRSLSRARQNFARGHTLTHEQLWHEE